MHGRISSMFRLEVNRRTRKRVSLDTGTCELHMLSAHFRNTLPCFTWFNIRHHLHYARFLTNTENPEPKQYIGWAGEWQVLRNSTRCQYLPYGLGDEC
jgi:hypothetical protein